MRKPKQFPIWLQRTIVGAGILGGAWYIIGGSWIFQWGAG